MPEFNPQTDPNDLYYLITAMEMYGGAFVQALAKALGHADKNNKRKIFATWPAYIKQYSKTAIKLKKNGQ